jgi:hypothetical protein
VQQHLRFLLLDFLADLIRGQISIINASVGFLHSFHLVFDSTV